MGVIMAGKKDKLGIESLRSDIQTLQESFWQFRDAMLTDAALEQAEQQQSAVTYKGLDLPALTATDISEAADLMAAVGHPIRLRMTILLAQNPVSATELVKQLDLGTTGAAYHHLKVLQNQGLVEQPQRGTFQITAEATQRVHQLLGGLFGAATEESEKSSKKKKSKA